MNFLRLIPRSLVIDTCVDAARPSGTLPEPRAVASQPSRLLKNVSQEHGGGFRGRQGDLRGKAHLEPLLSPVCEKALPSFAPRPQRMAGLVPILSMVRLCRFAEQTALPRSTCRRARPLKEFFNSRLVGRFTVLTRLWNPVHWIALSPQRAGFVAQAARRQGFSAACENTPPSFGLSSLPDRKPSPIQA
jgi:hypothetical protein